MRLRSPALACVLFLLALGLHAQGEPFNVKKAVQKALPSVVKVDVVETSAKKAPDGGEGSPFFEFFFDNPDRQGEREFRSESLGSGVIVKKVGQKYYVLTNAHVVAGADTIRLTLDDGREYTSTLVGQDLKRDLALLVMETTDNLPVISIGDSGKLEVGDWVIAIGSPYGFQSTVTLGIVSALQRRGGPGETITDFIQTDAAINKGNSGGALVNLQGELVGINSWISSQSGGSIGLGFAVPSRQTTKVIDDLIKYGKLQTPWLGINMFTLDREIAMAILGTDRKGALVTGLYLDSPAWKSGLVPGDVIISLDGDSIKSSDDIILAIANRSIKEKTVLSIVRGKKTMSIPVVLEERLADTQLAAQSSRIWPGFSVYPINDDIRKEMKLEASVKGLVVRQVISGGPVEDAGLKFGDIITAMNGKPSLDMESYFNAIKAPGALELGILRAGNSLTIGIPFNTESTKETK